MSLGPTKKKWCVYHGAVDSRHDCTFDPEFAAYRKYFGDRELPAELASKLLEGQADRYVTEWGQELTSAERELLEILAEECAEVVQRVTKILRFGKRRNPWDGKDNVDRLENELGDVVALVEALELLDVIKSDKVAGYAVAKLKAFETEENPQKPRLRYAGKELLKKGLSALITKLCPPSPTFNVGDAVEVDYDRWYKGVVVEVTMKPKRTKLYKVRFEVKHGPAYTPMYVLFDESRIRKVK